MMLQNAQLNLLKSIAETAEFDNLKLNYAVVKNQKNIDKVLEDIKSGINKTKDIKQRIKYNIEASQELYDVAIFKTEPIKDKKIFSVGNYYLYDYITSKSEIKSPASNSSIPRVDILNILNVIIGLKDLEVKEKTAKKIVDTVYNIVSVQNKMIKDPIFLKKIKFDIEMKSDIEYDFYKKDKKGGIIFNNKNEPEIENPKEAEKILIDFYKKNEKLLKEYNEWLKEEEEIYINYLELEDLPKNTSKQQVKILMNFIK